jgi:tRNA modification GTPase
MLDPDDAHHGDGDRGGLVHVGLLTPAGRGALAVVGVAGAGAAALIDGMFRPRGGGRVADRPDGEICFGRLQSQAFGAGEDVVVARLAADHCEVHCHGGLAASRAVIDALVARGAAVVSWESWLRRGLAEGNAADEARIAICRAGGTVAAQILGRQIAGALDREIDRIGRLWAAGDHQAAVRGRDRLLRSSRFGLRLTTPWRVAVVGPVNAGKSSLLNALAGHARSIVSPLPGTTRDLVTARLVIGGWEIEVIDTAGLRDDRDAADSERAGIERARDVQAEVDLVIRVTAVNGSDAGSSPVPADSDPGLGRGRPGMPAVIDVISKADLAPDRRDPVPGPAALRRAIVTSAVTGLGIDRLATAIVAALVPEAAASPDLLTGAVPFTSAQVAVITRLCAGAGVSPPSPPSSGRGAGA